MRGGGGGGGGIQMPSGPNVRRTVISYQSALDYVRISSL